MRKARSFSINREGLVYPISSGLAAPECDAVGQDFGKGVGEQEVILLGLPVELPRLLLGFICPLVWYVAAFLYLFKYYNRDPRERSGLAACAIAVSCIGMYSWNLHNSGYIISLAFIEIHWLSFDLGDFLLPLHVPREFPLFEHRAQRAISSSHPLCRCDQSTRIWAAKLVNE
ncbi:hypothetical protein KSP40_PGU015389 [Platanthera guangdongensis]|uniref:Uncharacterized protein n=1 Tax=Platanthera guangdongensis TaxID=2320717 RepID=A0ABR2N0L5_9ASPA